MKTIVHLIFSFEIGGAENLIVDIINEQANNSKVDLIVINKKYNNDLLNRIRKEVKIKLLNRSEGDKFSFLSILKLWYYLVYLNPTIIHCHDHKVIKLLRFWKKKSVITIHQVGCTTQYLKEYRQIFAISNSVKEDLLERGALESKVVENGIMFEDFKEKKIYHLEQNKIKIVQVSRLIHEIKGQDIAIRSIKKLKYEYGFNGVSLHLIGEGKSNEYLKALAKKLDVEDEVIFVGSKDRKWIMDNLYKFDILLQPSLSEGFGLTIVEGICAGLPVVASNINAPTEILKAMPSGFLFESGCALSLAQRIKETIELYNLNSVEELCKASRIIASSKYSIRFTSKSYIDSY